jgi:hypothetical protein
MTHLTNALIYPNELKNWFLTASSAIDFESACIAQLIQVELLRHRLRRIQIRGFSLSNYQILNHVGYIKFLIKF